ncbi:MAG: methyltransferase domain-containing protein [Hydrogenophilales bacterium]|nr:methyltransferase domain-containing protein [Hydrogenophilales bacterium]
MKKNDLLASVLKCNACQSTNFDWQVGKLVCTACGHNYNMVHDKPVMYDNSPVNGISRGDSHDVPSKLAEYVADGRLLGLNLGAGNSTKPRPNIINVDYLLYSNADAAVDAHQLPFVDQAFDVVASFNVFEHLINPEKASSEIFRVLKPGGRLIIHTAFLQPLHMEPYHYFNATEYGIRHWFKDFNIEQVAVSPNFSPLLNLAWMASIIQSGGKGLSKPDRLSIGNLTLDQLATFWQDTSLGRADMWTSDIFNLSQKLPDSTKAAVAGGFELEAVRPKQ